MAGQVPKYAGVSELRSVDQFAGAGSSRETQVVPPGVRVWLSHIIIDILPNDGAAGTITIATGDANGTPVTVTEWTIPQTAFDRFISPMVTLGFEIDDGLVLTTTEQMPVTLFYKEYV